MRIIISIYMALFFLSGCGAQKRVVVKEKAFPAWYENPMKSNSDVLYAVGEGETKRMAINTALNEILATLSVSISSEFKSKKEVGTGSYKVSSSSEVHAKVQAVKISNYEVINESDYGFEKYLVQVRIQKKELFTTLKKEVDSSLSRIMAKEKNMNAIKKLQLYEKEKKKLAEIENTLSVMRALDSSFDDSPFMQKIVSTENRYAQLLSSISFSIHTDKDSANLKSSIAKGLSDGKFRLDSLNNKNHFRIYVSSQTAKAKAYGFSLARSAIVMRVKDYRGSVIGSNKLNLVGQSTQGYAIAKENIAVKLNAKIRKEGIQKLIGLGL